MDNRPARPLSPTEQAVFDVVVAAEGEPVSVEEICAQTLLDPDTVTRAAAVLIEYDLIVVHQQAPEPELELQLAAI